MQYDYGFGANETPQSNNTMPLDDNKAKTGGVNFRYLELNKEKVKWEVFPIQINAAGQRFDINEQTRQTDRTIIGVVITTDDIFDADGNVKTDAQKCINDSTINLLIDSQELFPSDFACELISQKQGKTMYECVYPCYERAAGSMVTGYIKSSSNLYTRPFTAKIHICCIADDKK